MYDKTKVFPIREPEGGGGGGGDVTAAGNNTFTGVNTFENNVNLGKSDSIITVNGTLKDGDGNEYVTTTDVATKNSTGVVQIGDYIDVDENGVISSNDTRKASIEDLKDGTLVPKLADNMTPYAEDSGTTQTQPFFNEGTATGNGESRVDAKQVPAYAFLQEKRGNMVCVNQKVQNSDFSGGVTGWRSSNGTLAVTGGIATLTCSADGNATIDRISYGLVTGHKNIVVATMKAASGKTLYISGVSTNKEVTANGSWQILSYIEEGNPVAGYPRFGLKNAVVGDEVQYSVITISDLTQWFNGNIPAYLLSHPEAFGRYYKGSLAYEPGRPVPATGRYLTSVGRNIWDEEWEQGSLNQDTGVPASSNNRGRSKNFIEVIPNATYYFKKANGVNTTQIFQYDANKNFIRYVDVGANNLFITFQNCCYIKFRYGSSSEPVTTYNHDITISEYYSGESGYDQYYPYEVLATIDTGTESLYSAGSAHDSKVPSGLITRRIGSGNLTGLNFIWDGVRWYANAATLGIKLPASNNDKANILHGTLMAYPINSMATDSSKLGIGVATNGNIYVYNNDSTASPTGTVYFELAEPTTEQGTPFQENVPIDDFGQLSWSDTDVPQGNQIFYPVDYKAYEDTLIKYTDGDATSLVRNTDYASYNKGGVGKVDPYFGVNVANGIFQTVPSTNAQIKEGSYPYAPIVPSRQYRSVFYGLSRAAGVNLASSTEETAPDGTNPGVYPAAAKTAIQNMLGITDLIGDINTVLDSVNGVVI